MKSQRKKSEPQQSQPESDSLPWLAFQYLAEELSPTERAAFETRLGEDQAAREALAAAVELTMATQAVFADDAVQVATRDKLKKSAARQGWWSVALACGGLFALVAINKLIWQPPATPGSQELANAWVETRAAFPTSAAVQNEEEASAESFGDIALTDEYNDDLPTWMLAAVSASTKNMNMSETQSGDMIPE